MPTKKKSPACQIFHACTLLPAEIDVYVNGIKCIHALKFGEITQSFEVKNVPLSVIVTKPARPEQVLWKSVMDRKEDVDSITLVITEKNHTPLLSIYRDDSNPVAGRTKLRMIQLSPSTDPISIASERQVLFSNVAFGEARFLTLLPNTSTLHVCFTPSNKPMYKIPHLNFELGKTYTLFTIGKKRQHPDFRLLLLKGL
jgi:hypothetical protein